MNTSLAWNNDGTVTITKSLTFKVTDFIIDKLPETCCHCPCGYMANDEKVPCGRRIPLDEDRRSPDCKLRTVEQAIIDKGIDLR